MIVLRWFCVFAGIGAWIGYAAVRAVIDVLTRPAPDLAP